MKRVIIVAVLAIVMVSMSVNVYAFTDAQEASIEQQCNEGLWADAIAAAKALKDTIEEINAKDYDDDNVEDDSFFMGFFDKVRGR